jgi:hypothetical protein
MNVASLYNVSETLLNRRRIAGVITNLYAFICVKPSNTTDLLKPDYRKSLYKFT